MRKLVLLLALTALSLPIHADDAAASPYGKWTHGPSTDPDFFPLAVWMQSSRHAEQLHAAGINTYVALSDDLNQECLDTLKRSDIKLIVGQSPASLKFADNPTIIGWMHGDEPDNAQDLPDHKGYGPPIEPRKIVDEYTQMVQADSTRPVMLNLGLSVAYNEWGGRGTRTGHAEDYPEYIKGADIVSFDIYPVAGGPKEVSGKLDYVAQGVDHLVQVGKGEKVVWNCIECTHISEPERIATPHQVRAEVWMSLIHGSKGLIYFLHEFKPFKEAAILDNPEMLAAVTALNQQIASLAPALNSPTVVDGAKVQSDNPEVPVDILVKQNGGANFLFAVGMKEGAAKATFTLPDKGVKSVTVIGENRTIDVANGFFSDAFAPWDVHLYKW
jgi:hypothetical protein